LFGAVGAFGIIGYVFVALAFDVFVGDGDADGAGGAGGEEDKGD